MLCPTWFWKSQQINTDWEFWRLFLFLRRAKGRGQMVIFGGIWDSLYINYGVGVLTVKSFFCLIFHQLDMFLNIWWFQTTRLANCWNSYSIPESEVHGAFPHFCFMLSLKNVCFYLLHSPSHWHAPRSITNSGFFSCLISSQSAFVHTFLILNTWINYILHCVNHKAVNMWMYTISQVLSIFFKMPQKANYI